jgi:CheY-like chemotaxis protein
VSLCPDLVLMDVRLPGIDGQEASRRIRDLGLRGNGPVIVLLSTEELAEPAEWAAECGAAAYVPKSEFGSERLRDVRASTTGSS